MSLIAASVCMASSTASADLTLDQVSDIFWAKRGGCDTLEDGATRQACIDSNLAERIANVALLGVDEVEPEGDVIANEEPVTEPEARRAFFFVSETKSQIDDTPLVTISARSNERKPLSSFGDAENLTVMFRCLEDTTSLFIFGNNAHFADHQGYGSVTMRLDDDSAFDRNMNASTDNNALGLWRGGQSIPVIQRMIGHETLLVQVTPFSRSPTTFTFDIAGLEATLEPLREACHW